ncbi:hypothetical protein [Sphingosinicella sp. BN140058]|uniref:hypothetical protein n=1 Tax=Sphingosinicella sp. BN140058 TaxID=1892855 RepID=UPI00101033F0|nr:hypothetical protein [Sphingosinicella sp. BN140058]QAY80268.1 hypothetical protein ETR14_26860 [Sphingosinicella sp. BN140058]
MSKFVPSFVAIVTPASVSTRRSSKNEPYAYLGGATVEAAGRTNIATVMAFGPAHAAVKSKLKKGRKVELLLQRDGGTLRVLGFPKPAATAAA